MTIDGKEAKTKSQIAKGVKAWHDMLDNSRINSRYVEIDNQGDKTKFNFKDKEEYISFMRRVFNESA